MEQCSSVDISLPGNRQLGAWGAIVKRCTPTGFAPATHPQILGSKIVRNTSESGNLEDIMIFHDVSTYFPVSGWQSSGCLCGCSVIHYLTIIILEPVLQQCHIKAPCHSCVSSIWKSAKKHLDKWPPDQPSSLKAAPRPFQFNARLPWCTKSCLRYLTRHWLPSPYRGKAIQNIIMQLLEQRIKCCIVNVNKQNTQQMMENLAAKVTKEPTKHLVPINCCKYTFIHTQEN